MTAAPAVFMVVCGLALGVGFLVGCLYEHMRRGGSLDLSGRLGDARREIARRKAADLARTDPGGRDDEWPGRVTADVRWQP